MMDNTLDKVDLSIVKAIQGGCQTCNDKENQIKNMESKLSLAIV